MKTKILIGALLVGLLAGTSAWVSKRATAQTAKVTAGPVAPRVITRAIVVPTDGVAEVRARVDGKVSKVHVREGDQVEAGALLAEIDSEDLVAELARREAEHRAAIATAAAIVQGVRPQEIPALEAESAAARQASDLAIADLARKKKLVAQGALASDAVEVAERNAADASARRDLAKAKLAIARAGGRPDDVRAAKERVAAAAAAVDGAKAQLARCKVYAPIAGVILARRIDPGDTISIVNLPPALFDLADVSRTEVRVEVEEADAPLLEIGLAATLVSSTGQEVGKGKVVRVGARFDKRTIGADAAVVRADGLVRTAFVAWDAPRPSLAIGQRLEAILERPARVVGARVPRRAVKIRDGLALVDVAGGLFPKEQPVRLGAADDTWVEIAGLAEGASVVLPAN